MQDVPNVSLEISPIWYQCRQVFLQLIPLFCVLWYSPKCDLSHKTFYTQFETITVCDSRVRKSSEFTTALPVATTFSLCTCILQTFAKRVVDESQRPHGLPGKQHKQAKAEVSVHSVTTRWGHLDWWQRRWILKSSKPFTCS